MTDTTDRWSLKRTLYESEIRDCERVCFKATSDTIDVKLRTCSVSQERRKRADNLFKRQSRIIGGQTVSSGMHYVAKLVFDNEQQCAGTIIDKNFILTTKFCCQSGDDVAITFDSDSDLFKSNTFYIHPTVDSCLIRSVFKMMHLEMTNRRRDWIRLAASEFIKQASIWKSSQGLKQILAASSSIMQYHVFPTIST